MVTFTFADYLIAGNIVLLYFHGQELPLTEAPIETETRLIVQRY